MGTAIHQRLEPALSDRPIADPVDRRKELMEEACLTGLSVLGGLFFLALLLVVVELLYFWLTMQNGMIVLPVAGVS